MLCSPASAVHGFRAKYANVLRHYSLQATDSLKYKAALFIIDNMEGHCSPEGIAMDNYIAHIQTMKKAKGIRELQATWQASLKDGDVDIVPDSAVVSEIGRAHV